MRRGAAALVHLGTVVVVLGLAKYHAGSIGGYDMTESSRLMWSLAYIGLLSLAAYTFGFPHYVSSSPFSVAIVATGAAALGMSFVQLLVGSALLPRFVVLLSAVILATWYGACALIAQGGRDRRASRERVVAVVTEEEAVSLRQDMNRPIRRPASLVRALTVQEAAADGRPLFYAAREERATLVVLDRAAQAHDSIVAQAADLHEAGMRVRTLALFYEERLGKLPVSELERVSLMFDIGEVHRVGYPRVKRVIDVAIALVGLVGLLLLIPFVAIGNVIANRGPLFYRQPRIGKGGASFDILKFRTMRPGEGREWTVEGDKRITPFGRVLRRTHLDELPQVLNILRGDLSTVGPRPEQPHYVEQLERKIAFYGLRHLVRPGLTGWAQVSYAYGSSELDALEKLQYEFYYLRHQDLALDLRIIFRTLRSVVRAAGR